MSDESSVEPVSKKSILERFQIQNGYNAAWTIIYGLMGAAVFILLSMVPLPFTMVTLFKFGIAPALAIIGVVAALRGPLAGFLTGYLGVVIYDLTRGAVVTMTLPAIGYGFLGLVVGLTTYDLTNGRSLIKLSVLSAVGFVFTILIVVAVGLTVEEYATLVALGFVMLPLLTVGLPSVILLTPVFARLWQGLVTTLSPRPRSSQ
ncbi:MAG: hypothetical protein EAX95_01125 [Candidatus Thorarchaeota archaeon]|nr:hypothetical protein [Candidatus Thorarchaeota archaeon]